MLFSLINRSSFFRLIVCIGCITFLLSPQNSFSQLTEIVVDETELSGLFGQQNFDGYTNYRLFAQVENPTDEVNRVIGDASCPLNVSSDAPFFISSAMFGNQPVGGNINSFLFGFLQDVKYSSVFAIGTGASGFLGVFNEDDSDGSLHASYGSSDGLLGVQSELNPVTLLAAAGEEWWTGFQSDGASIDINSTSGGAWFCVGGVNSLGVGVNNSVMLGSFTTNGSFSYNISVGTYESAGTIDYMYCDSNIPGLTFMSNLCTSVTACNYNPDAIEDDGSCVYPGDSCNDANSQTVNDTYTSACDCEGELTGCMNVVACNFEPLAVIDDGSCSLPGDSCSDANSQTVNDTYTSACDCEGELTGCMNVVACNFEPLAIIDDESCLFEGNSCSQESGVINSLCQCSYNLSGYVFLDDNYDGLPDEAVFIPFQTVTLEPLGLQIITDDFGFFNFGPIEPGQYTLSVNYTSEWTAYTTPQSYTISVPLSNAAPYYFGVTNEDTPDPTGCVDFYQWGGGVPCNDQLGYNICYRNMSPYPISGLIKIELDDLLSYNYSYPPAENIDGQVISWTFENLGSWDMYFDDIVVNTPSELNIGEFMTSTATMYADIDGELIQLFQKIITQEVTCAYDPNDITGIPEGYTDDHLVLPDTRMEYLIRFQNTGNAPAGTVMVVDSLDEDMDFSTFQLVANSHSVMTTIDENGRVEFLFEDINLPDSIADEPGSHGMISYKIDFIDNIEIGEEVNQTGYIYFDNNPPVITNTTWHTAHECGGESNFELSATEICIGEEVSMTSLNPLVEDYQWNIESTSASTVSEYSQVFTEEGEYIIQFIAENPLCNESSMQMLNVYELSLIHI